MQSENDIYKKLKNAVLEGDADKTEKIVNEAISKGVDPLQVLEQGLAKGVREVGDRFGRHEVFLTDLILSGNAMKVGSNLLKSQILKQKNVKAEGRVVIGTVSGDVHSIGKDIVATLMEASGFEIIDLGEDVPNEVFVEKVIALKPDVVALSALMTVTMTQISKVIKMLEKKKLRDKVRVIVGGAPVTETWARNVGADAWAEDAPSAVKKLRKILHEDIESR